MEHLIVLLIHVVGWLDRRSLKPLNKAVPNLGDLTARPGEVLAEGEVVIGPHKRWASSIAIGLVVGALAGVLVFALLLVGVGRPLGQIDRQLRLFVGIFAFGLVPLVGVLLIAWVRWGATMVLRRDGVEIAHRQTRVVCPWTLFNVPGAPFEGSNGLVLVPVQSAAVPQVEHHHREMLVGKGAVKAHALEFKAGNVAQFRRLYRVEAPEIAGLLLQIGRQLGTDLPAPLPDSEKDGAPTLAEVPRLLRRRDGWIRASLVHLSFPPYCCECGGHTTEKKEFHGFSMALRFGSVEIMEAGDTAKVEVPLCPDCRKTQDKMMQRCVGVGLLIGVGVVAGLVGLLCLVVGNWLLFGMAIPLGVLGLIFGGTIGYQVGKRKASPLRLRDYAADEGMLTLQFRNPDYADALMELLDGEEEPIPEAEPAGEGGPVG